MTWAGPASGTKLLFSSKENVLKLVCGDYGTTLQKKKKTPKNNKTTTKKQARGTVCI